jgi:CheY-like chemotaxis protein
VTVIHASRGADAIQLASRIRPDLILLDISLEDNVDGWKVLHHIRSQESTRNIPVVVLSALDDQGNAAALGATDYLVKPIARTDLLNVLDRFGPRDLRDVLVVDDDADSRDVLSELLTSEGYRVRTAVDGHAGCLEISRRCPQLLILDLMMPNRDGFSVLQAVRENPDTAHLPVIVVSSLDLTTEQFNWLRERGSLILQKSTLSLDRLVSEVDAALRPVRDMVDA